METRTDESDRELDQLESKIGGAWVTWAGVGLLLLALGYFLKYAFDREWLSRWFASCWAPALAQPCTARVRGYFTVDIAARTA